MSKVARLKELVRIALARQFPEIKMVDSEDEANAKKSPLISFSADAGTEFEKASYGTVIGKTSLKLDVYLCVGRDLEAKNKADTDAIQEKIRKTVLADADILNEFSELNCSKIMAMDIPGENGLRVLCHDFEVSWLDV